MSDEPAWRRAIKKAGERLAGPLGFKKSKPATPRPEAGATFQDLTPDQQSEAVKNALKLSNRDDRATAIASIARDIDHIVRLQDRSSVIDAAIKNLGAEGRLSDMGRSAIVSARAHLQQKHQSKLFKIVRRNPELNQLINEEINNVGKMKTTREFFSDALNGMNNEQMTAADVIKQVEEQKARAGLMNSVQERDRER